MNTNTPDRVDPSPFEPTDEELGAIWRRVRATNERPAPARPDRRAWWPRLSLAIPGAVALVAAIAFAPAWLDRHGDGGVSQPGSASAALRSAGAAAADAEWRPITDGGYHHVFAITFRPDIEPVFETGPEPGSMGGFGSIAHETWLDAGGRGMQLDFWGGPGDPEIFPDIGNPDRNGEYRSFGYSGAAARAPMDMDAALRHADSVAKWRWRAGEQTPVNERWVRSPDGYVLASRDPGSAMHVAGKREFERAQIEHWGDTLDRLAALDGLEGQAADDAILELLDGDPVDNSMNEAFPIVGQMGITRESRAEERRIQRAVELLGRAPLAPSARRAIFHWLAGRPTARLEGPVRDGAGRSGTRVTFETRHDEPVPARRVTIDDLVADQRAINTIVEGPIPDIGPWKVPAHREQRRWYVTVTFDERSGELLEHALRVETNTTAKLPWLSGTMYGPLDDLKPTWDVMWNELRSGSATGTRYLARERTTRIEPLAEVCGDDPRICAP